MVRVKICGLMREEDIVVCAGAGVHTLGFVVEYPQPVPWNLTADDAAKLIEKVPPPVLSCVVTGGDKNKVLGIADRIKPDMVQLHGDETLGETAAIAAALKKLGIKCVRALRVERDGKLRFSIPDPAEAARQLSKTDVSALLVDSYMEKRPGGTGIPLDMGVFDTVYRNTPLPVIAGGGLKADNLREILGGRKPFAIDVLTGVESAYGVKDQAKISALMAAAMAL